MLDQYPCGRLDLKCTECGTIYEYFNHHTNDQPPRCPDCGGDHYERVYTTLPFTITRKRYENGKLLWGKHNTIEGGKRQFTDAEYRAMAKAHSLNTGERVSWTDVKKEVETKYTHIPFDKGAK